jgi:hypothetical protein
VVECQVEVDKEHGQMVKNDVWNIIPKASVLLKTKIFKSLWAIQCKADGTMCAQYNAKSCSEVAGQHYDADSISSPVINTFSIYIAFTIILMCGFMGWAVDVNGAFLLGEFKKGHSEMYMNIPKRMEKWYTKYTKQVLAKLKKCMYDTKQAARYYYDKIVSVMKKMECDRSRADPCLFFKYDSNWGLLCGSPGLTTSYVLLMQSVLSTRKSYSKSTSNAMTLARYKSTHGTR